MEDMLTIKLKVPRKTPKAAELQRTQLMNVGVRLVKTVASKTTSATVLASATFHAGCCKNESHERQTRCGQGRESRARGLDSAGDDYQQDQHSPRHCESYRKHGSESILADRVKIARGARGNRYQPTDARGVAEEQLAKAQRKADLGMECKLRYDARTPVKHFKAPARRSRTKHQGPMKANTEEKVLDRGANRSSWMQSMAAVAEKVVAAENRRP